MPKYEEMSRLLARDPVAHVLGLGFVHDCLPHHGKIDEVKLSDGSHARGFGGGINFIANLHGPIEEQARLSKHSHMCIQFVSRQS